MQKKLALQRFAGNPILVPDDRPWRNVVTFNPGAIVEDGVFYLIERACSSLAPRVVFPSATVAHNGTLFVYYGCCDTWIGAATVAMDEILDYVCSYPV